LRPAAVDRHVEGAFRISRRVVDLDANEVAFETRVARRHGQRVHAGLVHQTDGGGKRAVRDTADIGLAAAVEIELADLVGEFAARRRAVFALEVRDVENADRHVHPPAFGHADEGRDRRRDAGYRPRARRFLNDIHTRIADDGRHGSSPGR
jgi:hypothetical protein